MAQTTHAFNGAGAKVSISTDASAFTDISGYAASVEVSGGDQVTGGQFTHSGDAQVVTGTNKTEPITVTVNVLYTDEDAQPFDVVWDRFKGAAKTLCVRWSPNGGAAGDEQYTTTDTEKAAAKLCPIVSCTPPPTDAASGDPIMFSFSVICADLLKATIST